MPGLEDIPGTHKAVAYIPGQSTANSADGWPIMVAPDAIVVTAVRWTPAAAVTGNNTNYFSLALQNRGSAGTGTTAVTSTKDYTTGVDSVAYDSESLTLSGTAANTYAAAGDVLALTRTVAASGLAQPDGLVEIEYQYR